MLCATGPFKSVGSAGNRLSTGSSTTGIFYQPSPLLSLSFLDRQPAMAPYSYPAGSSFESLQERAAAGLSEIG
jgi:hypothetical protein